MTGMLLTDRGELQELFDELEDELAQLGAFADVVMVGGAWMLWHSYRLSTRDVDSARRFDSDLSQAVERVGARHDLPPAWLNDNASSIKRDTSPPSPLANRTYSEGALTAVLNTWDRRTAAPTPHLR
jgi:hypothetical protein